MALFKGVSVVELQLGEIRRRKAVLREYGDLRQTHPHMPAEATTGNI